MFTTHNCHKVTQPTSTNVHQPTNESHSTGSNLALSPNCEQQAKPHMNPIHDLQCENTNSRKRKCAHPDTQKPSVLTSKNTKDTRTKCANSDRHNVNDVTSKHTKHTVTKSANSYTDKVKLLKTIDTSRPAYPSIQHKLNVSTDSCSVQTVATHKQRTGSDIKSLSPNQQPVLKLREPITTEKPTCSTKDQATVSLATYFADQHQRHINKQTVIMAHMHQGNKAFHDSSGKQCTCNCLVFLFATIEQPILELASANLDKSLYDGTSLYRKISTQLNQDLLLIPELQRVFIHNKHYYKLEIANESYGVLSSTHRNETSATASDIAKAITNAFTSTPHVFLVLGNDSGTGYTMSLYKEQTQIYYFDPHARDRNGNVSPQGTAVLMYFRTDQELVTYITHIGKSLHCELFEVVSVTICTLNRNEYTKQYNINCQTQKRAKLDAKKINHLRFENTHSRSRKRANLDAQKINELRDTDTTTRQRKRAELDKEKVDTLRQTETTTRKRKRAELDQVKLNTLRDTNTTTRQTKRAELDKEKVDTLRQTDTTTRQTKRTELDKEKVDTLRQTETRTRKRKRAELDQVKLNTLRDTNTTTRQTKRAELDKEKVDTLRQTDTRTRKRKRAELDKETVTELRSKHTRSRKLSRDLKNYEAKYESAKSEFPVYVCVCCQRTWFRKSVVIFNSENYANVENQQTQLFNYVSFDGVMYICNGCHQTMKKGKVPVTASANQLKLDTIPEELQTLTELESVLIAQRIVFFKLVNLPRGGQKKLTGSFVNVPVDTENVCTSLPRTVNEGGIIPLQLKRRISYKGYSLHENIRPHHVLKGLEWLTHNNDLYQNVKCVHEWENKSFEESEENYNTLFNTTVGEKFHTVDDTNQIVTPEINTNAGNIDTAVSYQSIHMNDSIDSTTDRNTNCDTDIDVAENEQQITENDGDDNVEGRLRGTQYSTCMHPNDSMHTGDQQYSIAPGEGRLPVSVFEDKNCEALAFPQLFPTGRYTLFGADRRPISAQKYFLQRLTNSDNRFATCIPYLFFGLNICEKQQIQSSVTIALRKASRRDITVGQLRDTDVLKDILIKDQAFNFLQQVRGSPSYWQLAQYELLAMVRAKGIFTWFLTLSCADLNWPETIQGIALQAGQKLSKEDVQNLTYEEKCKWLQQNPVTAARMFDNRLQSMLRDVIQGPGEPICKVTHMFQRTEFQLRGSPHCHAVLWVENAPILGNASEEEISQWIDKYISCDFPPSDDPLYEQVSTKQIHTHSVACKKKGNFCRFHFPKPPSELALLSKPPESDIPAPDLPRLAQETLAKVNTVLTSHIDLTTMSLDDILLAAEVTKSAYYTSLRYSKGGTTVMLKRDTSSLNVNNYNKELLRIWKANMDLQFVCDQYGCISYIVAYITKDERELSQMLKDAAREMTNSDVKSRLRKVGSVYLNHRELSAQEAAYRLLSIPLKRCSAKMVWIPTDLPGDRIGILKPQAILDAMEEEDDDIYSHGIVDKYIARPRIPALDQLCLAEFATWYDRTCKLNEDDIPVVECNQTDLPKHISLLNAMGIMRKRTTAAIPRYHVFSQNKESEKYYHQQMMLFFPWRDEHNDIQDVNCADCPYECRYNQVRDTVQRNKNNLEHHSELVDGALEEFEGPPQHAWDMLDPLAEQTRTDEDNELRQAEVEETTRSRVQVSARPITLATAMKPKTLHDEQLKLMIQQLNFQQRNLFQYVIHWCKQQISSLKSGSQLQPFHIFLTGGAGTGKSQLVRAVFHQATKILHQAGDNPDYPVVLFTSSTGTAAYNIGGCTLHRALQLPMGRYYSLKSNPSLLATMKLQMSQVKILIIDEVSMIGRKVLSHVHRRLQELKGNFTAVFGGVSILGVGDLYKLPPVKQYKMWDTTIRNPDDIDQEELAVVLSGLWDNTFSLFELHQIMRQKDDQPFAELLNRIRTGDHTQNDIELLSSRIVSKEDPLYPEDSLHMFAQHVDIQQHNDKMLEKVASDKIQIHSITKVPKSVKNFDEGKPISGLKHSLCLCKNARIMLIKNVDVCDGLVNGATGILLDIVYEHSTSSMPKAAIIKFDDSKTGRLARQSSKIPLHSYDNGIPILPFEAKEHVGRSETSP